MAQRDAITFDWTWLKQQISDAVFNFFLPWRSFPRMRQLVREALREPPGIDHGPLTHSERNKLLFGIDAPCDCPKCRGPRP